MTGKRGSSPESIVREIKRKTRRKFRAEEKIRIVLEGLRGEAGITDLCRKEGIHPTMYYKWSKAFLEAGKRLTSPPSMHCQQACKIDPLWASKIYPLSTF
jgi:transposase